MKRLTTLLIGVGISLAGIAQNVGIGTSTPNASALLELQSTNKGLLLPRVADTNAVASPAKGLVIYSTTANALFYYNGSSWQNTANSGSGDLWYQYQDSVLMTDKKYVSINPNPNLKTPMSGLSVNGNLSIQKNTLTSNTTATPAQTFTMNNTSGSQLFTFADSVNRIFDPGGPNNNYTNNMQGNVISVYGTPGDLGINISFNEADFGIASGDTLWISYSPFPFCRTNYQLMLTNTSTIPNDLNIRQLGNGIDGYYYPADIYFVFRSNADGQNSKGFDISIKKVYEDRSTVNVRPANYGESLFFDSEDGSFQAGSPASAIGKSAICIGCRNADGVASFASVKGSALGKQSIAMLFGIAEGDQSFSLGNSSRSIGYGTVSLGGTALSYVSTSIGLNNDTFPGTSRNSWINTDPLVYFGNGRSSSNRSNAMVIYKNANVDINGYTRLGKLSEGAPVIKMKELLVTSGFASNTQSAINHGLDPAKIISVSTLMEWTPGYFAPAEYGADPLLRYNYFISPTQIVIQNNAASCAHICSKPVKILITYKE
jgi:hypothetical protein